MDLRRFTYVDWENNRQRKLAFDNNCSRDPKGSEAMPSQVLNITFKKSGVRFPKLGIWVG